VNKKAVLIFSLFFVLILAVGSYFLFVRKYGISRLDQAEDFNYILITVDTLRADRIGCYGFSGISTPTMDMFASRGVKFEKCISAATLTLPSHTSLMTGTYPTFHGVRDNGGFLVPQEITTLAELMKQHGYKTSAYVAAYVLDSKWGLDQGFDHYFDSFDLSKYKTVSLGNVQRPGNEVIDEVLPWLEEHKQEKFFTWIHLYDPHSPYEPPEPYNKEYPNHPYSGEIAYTDSQLARLWQFLEENDLVENTVLVFAADHGESLGEHQEQSHGFFIYQEGVHVPLIFVTPFEKLHGISSARPVSLVDVMPTILDLAGIQAPSQVQGKSLRPLFFKDIKEWESIAYSETFYPRFHYGWSELKSLQDERYKLILAPELELYDLQSDPDEERNIIESQAAEARRMVAQIESFINESSRGAYELDYSHMDEESREKLAALGYIGSFADSTSISWRQLSDPKDKINIFNQLGHARELGLQEEYEQAVEMIKNIIAQDPDIVDAYFSLGNLYTKWGKNEEALESYFQVLDKKPDDTFTVINIANAYIRLNELEKAKEFVLNKLEILSPDSQVYFVQGNIFNFLKDYENAVFYYKKCLKLNPQSVSACNALGGIYVIQEKLDEAEELLQIAMGINPRLRNVNYNYAQLREAKGDIEEAIKAYKQELEYIPHNFRAAFNISRLYRISERGAEEQVYLEKTIEINPNFPLSYFYLARIFLNRGEKYNEAVSLIEKGIELKPKKEDLPLGYFLLADLYNRMGDYAKSAEYVRKGEAASEAAKTR